MNVLKVFVDEEDHLDDPEKGDEDDTTPRIKVDKDGKVLHLPPLPLDVDALRELIRDMFNFFYGKLSCQETLCQVY